MIGLRGETVVDTVVTGDGGDNTTSLSASANDDCPVDDNEHAGGHAWVWVWAELPRVPPTRMGSPETGVLAGR